MDMNSSFDSEKFDLFSDSDSENEETKSTTNKTEKEEDIPETKNYDLIKSISKLLETLLEDNKKLKEFPEIIKKQSHMVFSSTTVPNISLEKYLERIQKYTNIERSTLINSLIYIDRFCNITGIILTHFNIHRLLFVSILLSIKYNEDKFYNNEYYADIAGVKLKELKILEYTYANMIHFLFYIKDETYNKYVRYLNCNI